MKHSIYRVKRLWAVGICGAMLLSGNAVYAAETQYPITIEHALGTTVIEEEPERIVTIGWGNLDVPLALGIAPVGVSKATYGATDDNGLFYWTNEAFAELGVEEPNVFDDTDGLDFEAINNAEPDLILAVYSGISEEEYEQLSEIAPTVAYTEEAWATTWQDMTRDNAKALGKEEEAELLVAEIEQLIAEKTAEHPEIEGLTAAYCYFDTSNLGSFYVYMPKDPRASYLMDLGLELPEEIRALDDGSFFFMTISSENIDVLNNLDLIVTWGESDTLEALQADPLINQVPAISRGSVVFLSNDTTLIAASCTPTTLAIESTIDEYLDAISAAAGNLN
ncbi:MAG: iron-siderophore ABC transporter substrate-binding protein [Eubacteriales bacterium]|nr:iron-siderophore ABC transporter substrate-binding protein [Eubacteriales bacterium]